MTEVARRVRWWGILCACGAALACAPAPSPPIRAIAGIAQGTTYSLQWIGGGAEPDVGATVERELERIDALLSNYRSDSTLEAFNAERSVEPAELPSELVALLELARSVHAASGGCFDPTVRPLVRAWGFDGDDPAVPPSDVIEAARAIVGLDKLELSDSRHVRKTVPGLEIDMASIGQGYTAGRLADILEQLGSTAYLAEIGGEIVARGAKSDGTPWRVGLENPLHEALAGPTLRTPEARTAVVTSGSYRHYLDTAGRRFGHIIDPRAGQPVEHSLLSVTVIDPDAAKAAAWGTALLCLGPAEGLATAEREEIAAVFWIAENGTAAARRSSPRFAAEWQSLLDEPPLR